MRECFRLSGVERRENREGYDGGGAVDMKAAEGGVCNGVVDEILGSRRGANNQHSFYFTGM